MINRLLYKLTAGLPCRLISLDSGPYLERYYVGQLFGVTFYLHRFVSSDSERHLHNHPWSNGASIILSGSYVEEVVLDMTGADPSGVLTEKRLKSWFNRVDGNHFHRIHDAAPGTWTLFMHGARERLPNGKPKGWGFIECNHVGWDNGQFSGSYYMPTFRPQAPSTAADWWLTAPTGADSERVKL